MRKKGIRVTDKKPDINLVFVDGIRNDCVNVMRLDGAWINSKMNAESKNKKILKTMSKCKGVIYQSKFSKDVCEKFIGKHKRSTIIYNGCDPELFKDPFVHSRPYITTASRWRPHKRLKTTVDCFIESELYKTHDLIVCGEPDYVRDNKSVQYFGKQSIDKVQSIVAGSDFVVHLCYLDCCPNSVVESLVAGKNVLCSNSGGTPEIVKQSGMAIADKEFGFKFIDLYDTPALNKEDVIGAYNKMTTIPVVERSDLHINNTADQYIEFFKTVI